VIAKVKGEREREKKKMKMSRIGFLNEILK